MALAHIDVASNVYSQFCSCGVSIARWRFNPTNVYITYEVISGVPYVLYAYILLSQMIHAAVVMNYRFVTIKPLLQEEVTIRVF